MKWYFASRQRHRDKIKKITELLEENNQDIVSDWTNFPSLSPYHENAEKCRKTAEKIGNSLKDIDIFVLISDVGGTDMFIEIGIAIRQWMENKNIRIYVIGSHNKRSLMHFHPAIIHTSSIQEILKSESINVHILEDLICN